MLTNKQVFELLLCMAECYETNKEELSSYDAVIGDGDHGFSLARGNQAAKRKILEIGENASAGELWKIYGRELTCEVGGAMGPLFGLLFTQIGKEIGDKEYMGLAELTNGLSGALDLICELGGAKPGDKTMVDAIKPTVETLERSVKDEEPMEDALKRAYAAARKGVEATIPLQAKRGRSKYLREKSIGHQDAGATSFSYFIKTISDYVCAQADD